MDTDWTGSRAAQPADEEIKKHGDPLKKHVADVPGQQTPGSGQVRQDARDDKGKRGSSESR